MIIVFSVTANQVLRILRCESEVTSMCTPADDNILIVGTIVGSINLYDLSDLETNNTYRENELDYTSLMKVVHP